MSFTLHIALLVHCTYQIHCDFYKSISSWIKNPGLGWKSTQTSRRVNPMAASFHAFCLLPQLIAIVPPDITSFVGWNERNKVGVRDGGGAKRKRSTEIYE